MKRNHSLSMLTAFPFSMALVLALVLGCGGPKKLAPAEKPDENPLLFDEPAQPPAEPAVEKSPDVRKEPVRIPFILNRIHFNFDAFDLTFEALNALAQNAKVLQAYPDIDIIIEGHCDERGTIEYNLALGDKRARAARDYLVSLGVSPSRISVISYGKERPIDYGHNETAWARNRRAEFIRK